MNPQDFDQIKSYSTLLVAELHKAVLKEPIFDHLKNVLRLAEEMECTLMNIERKKREASSNVVYLRRIA